MIELHNHTPRSLLDSILECKDMFEFCVNNKQKAIAITDHGNMFGFVDFYKEALNIKEDIVKKRIKELDLSRKQKDKITKDIIKLLPKDKSIIDELKCNNDLKNVYKKYKHIIDECIDKEVKPIIECEVYEVDDMHFKEDTKEYRQPRYHLVLLAKNKKGLNNLFKIVSDSYRLGFYIKPRIDLTHIKENNLGEGIVCLTACQAGRLSRNLTSDVDKEKESYNYIEELRNIFDYVSLEIQSHKTESQILANSKIVQFAQKYNYPYVVTTDTHMANKEDKDAHAIFVCIGEGREVGEMYDGCYLQNDNDVFNTLGDYFSKDIISKAIEETENINSMIEWVDIGLNNPNQMPEIETPKEFKDNREYLRHLVYRGFNKKCNFLSEEERNKRIERIEMELPILYEVDYTDYFITLYLLVQKADKREIPRGYSRGSGANCFCLFALGVTQIDSVRWKLDFSRFANLGRKSMADFDFDISKRRRKEMVDISEEIFGKDKVVPICTFNTLSTKVAIRDIGKVLDQQGIYDLPYKIRDQVSKMIPTIKTLNDLGEEEEKDILLKEVLFKNQKLKEVNQKYPLWFKYVMQLEGKPKSLGRHAAGTLITPRPVTDYCPICLDTDGNNMAQLEMHNAMEDLKLIKMDYLGLKTLDIIDDTLKMANLKWKDVDINHLNLDDPNVYDYIYKKGRTTGIFQMESAEATKMCIEAQADNIEDIIAISAFNRPGTKKSFPTYIKNKENPCNIELIHEDLRSILKTTMGVLLYQEQTLQIFRYAGFPEEEVDNARRSIGKKIQEVMDRLYDDFKEKLFLKKWTIEQIDKVWVFILLQALYSFNRGHSVAYGLLSYLTAYLSYYYPVEFLTACLIADTGNVSKTSILINECKDRKIKVSPPNINVSGQNYTINKSKNEILFGILPIKGIGESTVEEIIKNRPYSGLQDFCNKAKVGKDNVISLIKAGALPCRSKKRLMVKYFDLLNPKKEYSPVITLPTLKVLKDDWGIIAPNKEERLKLYNEKRKIKFDIEQEGKRNLLLKDFKEKYMNEEYMWEFQTLSMFLSNNPFDKVYNIITPFNKVNNGNKAVIICVLVDIKRTKDRNGNQYAYLDLYTPFGMIESVCWASKYTKFSSLLVKGSSLAILGRKNEGKLFVESIKTFEQWRKIKNI